MLDLLEADPRELLVIEPFPVPSTSSRRRVVGLDVWIETRCDDAGALSGRLVGVLTGMPARLTHLDDLEGRALWPEPEDVRATHARARLMARDEDTHLTDGALLEVLAALSTVTGWSVVRKLEEFDGVDAFAPLGTYSQNQIAKEHA